MPRYYATASFCQVQGIQQKQTKDCSTGKVHAMNVLLVQPYATSYDPNNPASILNEPLGLLALATYLEHTFGNQVDISILDLYALGHGQYVKKGDKFTSGLSNKDDILRHIKDSQPDVIGVTCNFAAYADDAFEVAQLLKDYFKDVPVVIGGAHATMEAENVLRDHPYIDYVVRGEGELTFSELVSAIKNDEAVESISGLSFRNLQGEIVSNPDRELISDMNMLPIMDRKYVDMEQYKKFNARSLPFTRRTPVAIIMTSRGCPFNCVFCSTKVMWKRRWRPRSPENIVEEIAYLVNEYGIKEIAIEDDQFVLSKKRVHEMCDLILEKNLGISLSIPSGTGIWLVDYELLKKMKKAGFYRLCFPVETGCRKTMEFIGKPVDLTKVPEIIEMAHKLGYWTQGNFIIGFPYETRGEIQQTIRYAYESGLDYVLFFVAQPYAGAELHDILKNEGLLDAVAKSAHTGRSFYDTTTLTSQELNQIHSRAVKGFWIHKIKFYPKPSNFFKHLLPKLRSFEDIRYALKILFVLINRIVVPSLKSFRRSKFN